MLIKLNFTNSVYLYTVCCLPDCISISIIMEIVRKNNTRIPASFLCRTLGWVNDMLKSFPVWCVSAGIIVSLDVICFGLSRASDACTGRGDSSSPPQKRCQWNWIVCPFVMPLLFVSDTELSWLYCFSNVVVTRNVSPTSKALTKTHSARVQSIVGVSWASQQKLHCNVMHGIAASQIRSLILKTRQTQSLAHWRNDKKYFIPIFGRCLRAAIWQRALWILLRFRPFAHFVVVPMDYVIWYVGLPAYRLIWSIMCVANYLWLCVIWWDGD